ncbi:hypothetical protein Plhal304r1_c005g0022021 [Plasmopara halstedii]
MTLGSMDLKWLVNNGRFRERKSPFTKNQKLIQPKELFTEFMNSIDEQQELE